MLIENQRTIWMMDLFRDQEAYTSEITLNFIFTNPVSNFFDDIPDEDKAF